MYAVTSKIKTVNTRIKIPRVATFGAQGESARALSRSARIVMSVTVAIVSLCATVDLGSKSVVATENTSCVNVYCRREWRTIVIGSV